MHFITLDLFPLFILNENSPLIHRSATVMETHSQHCERRAAEVSEGCANKSQRLSLDSLWMLSGREGGREAASEPITEQNSPASTQIVNG